MKPREKSLIDTASDSKPTYVEYGRPSGSHQAPLLTLAGEFQEPPALLVIHAVQVAQVVDVPRVGAAVARFEAAHLRRAELQPFSDLLSRPAALSSELLEQRPEFSAPDGRTSASRCVHFSPTPPLRAPDATPKRVGRARSREPSACLSAVRFVHVSTQMPLPGHDKA